MAPASDPAVSRCRCIAPSTPSTRRRTRAALSSCGLPSQWATAAGHLLQPVLQPQARGGEGGPAVIRDRAAHGRTIALDDRRRGIILLLHGAFDPADPAHLL